MKKILCVLIVAAVTVAPSQTRAQAGIAIHAGTLGVGVDIGTTFGSRVGLRSGFSFFPLEIDATVSDIDYQIDFASPTFTVMLDLYLAGPVRLSGGAVYSTDDIVLAGELTGPVDINGTPYLPIQVGTLTGTVITNELSPYAGIGIGNPGGSKFGFFLDLGVAFHGIPGFDLTADGPASGDPQFDANLEAERLSIEDDLSKWPVYPVGKIGFSIGF
jgi:hypothetical protein